MRDIVTLARRLFETRRTVKALERRGAAEGDLSVLDVSRLLVSRGAMHALAWTLQLDLNQIDIAPPLVGLPELPTHVQIHRIELDPANNASAVAGEPRVLWLAEIPAHTDDEDPDVSTEYWSCFLTDQHARELRQALATALPTAPGRAPAPLHLPRIRRLAPLAAPPVPFVAPDVEGGYLDEGRREGDEPPPPALGVKHPKGA